MQIERNQSGMIQHIICAVRGGPESRETASSAVDLALKTDARLTFFHVVDPGCLDCGDIARSSAAYREYLEKAESAMRALCTQARQCGVTHVDFVLLEGDTRQELCQMAMETDAELMVLGHPNPDSKRSIFSQDEFHQFLAELDFGGELRTVQVRSPPHDEV
jgi:nucleotide-binding universal stress UspA family protein